MTTRNCAVTYYQTREWVPWTSRIDKTQKMTNIFKRLEKNSENLKKICVSLASACSSVASQEGVGGAFGC